jgi:hypothetical protein
VLDAIDTGCTTYLPQALAHGALLP